MGIYQELYELIETYVYGNSIAPGNYEELVCTLIATCACIFIVALPFVVVKKVIDVITGG